MPLIETRGAASAQGFGEFAQSAAVNYIEDVFSTYLYDGNGSTQTITTGLDAAGGGLVWIKRRTGGTGFHTLVDSANNSNGRYYLASNSTDALIDTGASSYPLSSTGFSLNNGGSQTNGSGSTYVSWTFREQKKFFDIVTYTGNGSDQNIPHNLGSVPGFVVVKRTSSSGEWSCWHRSIPTQYILLNSANAATGSITRSVTSTTYQIFGSFPDEGSNGATYVMYLFAHNAGGFGVTGADNVISCGSYSGTGGAGNVISLGYEPQFVIIKKSTNVSAAVSDWLIVDNMRGWPARGSTTDRELFPNLSNAENFNYGVKLNSTGFELSDSTINGSGETYIYIAIRRGPMKVPTSGTSVFYPQAITQADTIDSTSVPFPPDLVDTFSRNGTNRTNFYMSFIFVDRLRGLGTPSNTFSTSTDGLALNSSSTAAEDNETSYVQLKADSQNITRGSGWNSPNYGNWINYFFRRAPGFFDIVCFSGAYAATSYNHNLTVAPEMIIFKKRTGVSDWPVYHVGISTPLVNNPSLNLTAGYYANNWFSSSPTATTFSTQYLDSGTSNYVAYLFATLAGVSKVGSYTGTGTTKQIDCGFTGGARFVLIKRTDSTGDWYVWDTARGIVAGDDPYLLLNSTAAEVTNTDYVDTYSAGFELSSTAPAALNANGGTYIFLAIA